MSDGVGLETEFDGERILVGEVRRLDLRPGDVVVVETAPGILGWDYDHLLNQLRAAFPGTKVVLIEDAKLSVVRPEQRTP